MIFAAVLCAVVENDELCCEENEELGDVTDGGGVAAVPHFGQNLVVSLICAPQFLQNIKKSFFLHKNGGMIVLFHSTRNWIKSQEKQRILF